MNFPLRSSFRPTSLHLTPPMIGVAALLCVAGLKAQGVDSLDCSALSKLQMKGVSINIAERIPQGATHLTGATQISGSLPAFCRVALVSKPTPDSDIHIELWLPERDWNGRFLGTGNGGGAGRIAYGDMDHGLRRGFATANTDMGTAPNADSDVDHPERWADFGYRATHEMTWISKEIISAYYGKAPSRSYFSGCSTGGQQALMEAERYPEDYNGIIAGAPANNRTHLHESFLWNYRAAYDASGRSLLPATLLSMVTEAALKACRTKDGGAPTDEFLTDPRLCHFDLKSLPKCKVESQSGCVTPEQLAALERIYSGPFNTRTGERIYTPLFFGSEQSIGSTYPADPSTLPRGQFYPFRWVFGSNFNAADFDFNHDLDTVDDRLARILNANDADLSAFHKAGGKLLMYTGTADSLVPMADAVNFYERAIASSGSLKNAQEFFRYFLIPGMSHCGGGPGLNDIGQSLSSGPLDSGHNILSALLRWVEENDGPDSIMARKSGAKPMQRPVCAYPKFPEYRSGDPNAASNYACTDHPRGFVPSAGPRYLK